MTVSLDKEKKVYTLIYGTQSNNLISFDELNKSWNLYNFFTSLFSEYWSKVSLDDVHYKIKQIFEDYGKTFDDSLKFYKIREMVRNHPKKK